MRAKSLQSYWTLGDPMTFTGQVPLSVGFSRHEYSSRLPCLFQGIFLTQGSSTSLMFPALAGRLFTASNPWEAQIMGDLDLKTQILDLGSLGSSSRSILSSVTKSHTHNFFIKVFFFSAMSLMFSPEHIF